MGVGWGGGGGEASVGEGERGMVGMYRRKRGWVGDRRSDRRLG